MNGPSLVLDARVHAYRRDLAVSNWRSEFSRPITPARSSAAAASTPPMSGRAPSWRACQSQLLPGRISRYSNMPAAGLGLLPRRSYRRLCRVDSTGRPSGATNLVCERCLRSPPMRVSLLRSWPRADGVQDSRVEQGACLTTEYGCVSLSHLRRISETDDDPALVAERLIGAPYQEGGRTFDGVDGPGLIQLALSLCGMAAPRLADQQRELGKAVAGGASLKRNDLAFGADMPA